MAAAQRQEQQLEQYTEAAAAAKHICRAPYRSRRRAACRLRCFTRGNELVHAVSAGNIGNNTTIISYCEFPLYFRPERSCEHIRDVWFASSGTVVATWNRVRLVNARRGAGFLYFDGVGTAYFRRELAGIGRERVAGKREGGRR